MSKYPPTLLFRDKYIFSPVLGEIEVRGCCFLRDGPCAGNDHRLGDLFRGVHHVDLSSPTLPVYVGAWRWW